MQYLLTEEEYQSLKKRGPTTEAGSPGNHKGDFQQSHVLRRPDDSGSALRSLQRPKRFDGASQRKTHMNREAWLQAAVEKLKPIFKGHGYDVPDLQVSVGWPSRSPLGAKRAIGQCCWSLADNADKKPQIFISPLLEDVTEPMGVLATLLHEIVHAVVGCDAKHGPKFAKAAKVMGLEGKPTSTHASEDLVIRLKQISEELGAFPHKKIVPHQEPKKQTTRMKKATCDCGYTIRLAKKWADVGLPGCPLQGHGQLKLELPESEEPENE